MPSANFEIKGCRKLMKRLNQLSMHTQTKVLKSAVRKAAKPVVRDARKLVPRDTGLLRASLGTKVKQYPRTGTVVAIIGPRLKFAGSEKIKEKLEGKKKKRLPVNYAHLVEFGTKPHWSRYTVLPSGVIVPHGHVIEGARPRPFLRPAFDKNKQKIMQTMTGEIKKGITRFARRSGS